MLQVAPHLFWLRRVPVKRHSFYDVCFRRLRTHDIIFLLALKITNNNKYFSEIGVINIFISIKCYVFFFILNKLPCQLINRLSNFNEYLTVFFVFLKFLFYKMCYVCTNNLYATAKSITYSKSIIFFPLIKGRENKSIVLR